MRPHQLSAIVVSTAAAISIVVLAGVPFVRMVPLLLILGGPLVALLALQAAGAFEEAEEAGTEERGSRPVRRAELQHH
jgi:hypothetical protein